MVTENGSAKVLCVPLYKVCLFFWPRWLLPWRLAAHIANTHCALQHTTHTATHCEHSLRTATHYTHCNTLRTPVAHCNTLHTLQHIANTHCALQHTKHTATHYVTLDTDLKTGCTIQAQLARPLKHPRSSKCLQINSQLSFE